MLPENIEEDHYLGKGTEYLKLALFLILLIISVITISLFFTDFRVDIGSLLSGTIGVIVALLVAIFTFLAFYVQYDANKKIQAQFHAQSTTEHFYKMLDIHVSNVKDMSMRTYFRDFDGNFRRKIEKSFLKELFTHDWEKLTIQDLTTRVDEIKLETFIPSKHNLEKNYIRGRKVFLTIDKDFHACIYLIEKINKDYLKNRIKKENINKLTYEIIFWGTT